MSAYNQIESRVKIEIASKTYNICTNALIKDFNLQINKSLSPREKFLAAVKSLKNALQNEKINKSSLDDFSPKELRFAFLYIADLCFQKSEKDKEEKYITRENFVRNVCEYLEKYFEFKIERLHINAKTGRYQELKQNFRWLIRNTPIGSENGSKPSSILVFSP